MTIIILDLDSLLFGVLSHKLNKTDCKSFLLYVILHCHIVMVGSGGRGRSGL